MINQWLLEILVQRIVTYCASLALSIAKLPISVSFIYSLGIRGQIKVINSNCSKLN